MNQHHSDQSEWKIQHNINAFNIMLTIQKLITFAFIVRTVSLHLLCACFFFFKLIALHCILCLCAREVNAIKGRRLIGDKSQRHCTLGALRFRVNVLLFVTTCFLRLANLWCRARTHAPFGLSFGLRCYRIDALLPFGWCFFFRLKKKKIKNCSWVRRLKRPGLKEENSPGLWIRQTAKSILSPVFHYRW